MTKNYFLKSIMLFNGLMFMATALQAQIYFNSQDSGANNGSCWANLDTDLQEALAAVVSGDGIWVAAETYYPTQVTTDRDATFQLKNYKALYGGFTGTETMLFEREWITKVSILSSDLMQNDGLNFAKIDDNSYSNTR
jgi:trimeric autotransporter adhesin